MRKQTLATMYGVGLVKRAPGTAGSAVAALLAFGVLQLPYGLLLLMAGTLLFTILGTRSATRYMAAHGTAHDPCEIVIDELVGQWLTYGVIGLTWAYISYDNAHPFSLFEVLKNIAGLQLHADIHTSLAITLLGFAFFRLFDIWKPWPISLADRRVHGGWGVMLDDLLAAIPAGIVTFYALMYYAFSQVKY